MGVLYAIGALAVVISNHEAALPSLLAVFRDAFTGSAASGGFLGATFAYAFNRGVNRGLFSNEAGQGSAPIAHAAARADEPVSEGMVSILEPFLDTLVICSLTGLVILCSGVWAEKFDTGFQAADTEFVEGVYTDTEPADVTALFGHLNGLDAGVRRASGSYRVEAGRLAGADITVLHNRSVAEDVRFLAAGEPYTGIVRIEDGDLATDVSLRGRSLLHSVPAHRRGLQALVPGGLRPVRRDRRPRALRLHDGGRVVLLRGPGDDIPLRDRVRAAVPPGLRGRVLPRDRDGHLAGLEAVGHHARAHGAAEPARHRAPAPGDEGFDRGVLGAVPVK